MPTAARPASQSTSQYFAPVRQLTWLKLSLFETTLRPSGRLDIFLPQVIAEARKKG